MKILVAFNYSKSSIKALEYAMFFQKIFGGEVEVLQVLALVVPAYEMPFDIYKDEQLIKYKAMLEAIIEQKSKIFKADKSMVKARVEVGVTATLILLSEHENNFDLILMGTHDNESLWSRMLGSVSNSVIRYSKTPVMVVHSSSASPHYFTNVMFAIDNETSLDEALNNYLEFNKSMKANTDFVHFKNSENNIETQFENVLAKINSEQNYPYPFKFNSIESNKPLNLLDSMITEKDYDLLVLVRNGSGLINKYFRPSFSIKAVHKTEIPALIYKAKNSI